MKQEPALRPSTTRWARLTSLQTENKSLISQLSDFFLFATTISHFVAVNLNLGFSERFKTHMVQKWHSLACAVALDVSTQTYRVKTPAARPIVVSLALCSTSTSVSKDSTDMTGPKISSFTQVISSVQSPTRGKKKKGQECRNTDVTSRITYLKNIFWMHCIHGKISLTQYTWIHVVSTSEFGIWWHKTFTSTQHCSSLEKVRFTLSSKFKLLHTSLLTECFDKLLGQVLPLSLPDQQRKGLFPGVVGWPVLPFVCSPIEGLLSW